MHGTIFLSLNFLSDHLSDKKLSDKNEHRCATGRNLRFLALASALRLEGLRAGRRLRTR